VQRKREDASFSPKDQASADSFLQVWSSFQNVVGYAKPYDDISGGSIDLQVEKSGNAPFIQYYKSVMQNAASRKVSADDKTR